MNKQAIAPAKPVDADRETIREFNEFCSSHDPRVLASKVDNGMVTRTLAHIARIELWFRHYAAELRVRRPQ
jgi:hypothetical protein